MKSYKFFLAVAMFLFYSLLSQQTAYADTSNHYGNTTCFARTLGQLSSFNYSSGSLRNLAANPRSIICGLGQTVDEDDGGVHETIATVYLLVSNLDEPMDCVAYSRDWFTSALLDSISITISAGSNGYWYFGELQGNGTSSYEYIQCALPGNGRISGAYVYWSTDDGA